MISTSTTTTHYTEYDSTLRFGEQPTGLLFGSSILQYTEGPLFSKKDKHALDLVSDQIKVFVSLSFSPYHFIHDDLGEFLAQYEKTPDAKFIIDITQIANIDPLPSFLNFFFRYLNSKKVDYLPINFNKVNKININNFYCRNTAAESYELNDPGLKIHAMGLEHVKDLTVPATKKVYISRKNFKGRELSKIIKGRLPYADDNRMDDEKKVEDYFRSLGFEIAIPEDFKTFEDQINYFYEAKMVVSATSSGFINAFFMRPGSTMVELATPLISFTRLGDGITSPLSVGQQEIHHFYHAMSISLGHKYISIENKDRSSNKIIDTIESDNFLKGWLNQ